MASAFFHEDDYCQVEVLPSTARGYCLAEMGRIEEFADAHRDGAGWTAMYVRGESPQPLASLGITLEELGAAVAPLVPRFAEVLTGTSRTASRAHRWLAGASMAVRRCSSASVREGWSGRSGWRCAASRPSGSGYGAGSSDRCLVPPSCWSRTGLRAWSCHSPTSPRWPHT